MNDLVFRGNTANDSPIYLDSTKILTGGSNLSGEIEILNPSYEPLYILAIRDFNDAYFQFIDHDKESGSLLFYNNDILAVEIPVFSAVDINYSTLLTGILYHQISPSLSDNASPFMAIRFLNHDFPSFTDIKFYNLIRFNIKANKIVFKIITPLIGSTAVYKASIRLIGVTI